MIKFLDVLGRYEASEFGQLEAGVDICRLRPRVASMVSITASKSPFVGNESTGQTMLQYAKHGLVQAFIALMTLNLAAILVRSQQWPNLLMWAQTKSRPAVKTRLRSRLARTTALISRVLKTHLKYDDQL
jgi:hypothetical protein